MGSRVDRLQYLRERLRTADRCWASARGTFREWRRQDLVRRAWQDRYGRKGHPVVQVGSDVLLATASRDESPDRKAIEHVWRIAVEDRGARIRAAAVCRTGEEWMADVVVVGQNRYWARTGHTVESFDGDVPGGHGAVDFLLLLRPREIVKGFNLELTGATAQAAGRLCQEVRATPRDAGDDEQGPDAEALGMISGGDDFRVYIDSEVGVVLRAVKYVHSEPAEIREFLDIEFDIPLAGTLFEPPT